MSKISLLLQNVYENEYVLSMKLNYSEPKIYTGGVKISEWSKLSKKEKEFALSKRWYVYYSFRNPENGRLKKQNPIFGGANRMKEMKSRMQILKMLRDALSILLYKGYNPYKDNSNLKEYIKEEYLSFPKKTTSSQAIAPNSKMPNQTDVEMAEEPTIIENQVSIKEAFDFGLDIKKSMMSANSFIRYKSRINILLKWLSEQYDVDKENLSIITRKTIIEHLNFVLSKNNNKGGYNNARSDINSLFKVFETNELITNNFVADIPKLKHKSKKFQAFPKSLEQKIDKYLEEHDPMLKLFIQFICYNYLRPIEICRLKVGNIDIENKTLSVQTKSENFKIKRLPDILIEQLPNLSNFPKDAYLFTRYGYGKAWDVKEMSRSDYFTKRFKKVVKDHFNLESEYALYAFRHTYVSKLYKEFRKTLSPYETKSKLMLITGHSSMSALEKYLRGIDAEIPEDYSNLLR